MKTAKAQPWCNGSRRGDAESRLQILTSRHPTQPPPPTTSTTAATTITTTSCLDDPEAWDPFMDEQSQEAESIEAQPEQQQQQHQQQQPQHEHRECDQVATMTTAERKRKAGESLANFSARVKQARIEADELWRKNLLQRIRGEVPTMQLQHVRADDLHDDLSGWGRIRGTHRRMVVKNLIFCMKCGCWSSSRVSSTLTSICKGAPHPSLKHRLKRLQHGLHPLKSTEFWDDGTSTMSPARVIQLD